jgi:hypothetical protein
MNCFFSNFIVEPADRYNTALVCHRWRFLACHPRLWLRVERPIRDAMEPGVYPDLEAAVSAARSISRPPPLSLSSSHCAQWMLWLISMYLVEGRVTPFLLRLVVPMLHVTSK